MGLKEGTAAFLKLEDFEPPWRQAVLLANPGSGKKLIFAVRVTATETRSAESSGFSFFRMFRGKVYASRRSAKSNQEQLPSRAAGVRGCSTADLGAEPGLAVRHCLGQEKIEEGGPPKVGRAISSSRKRQPAAKERKLLPVAWKPFFNRTLPQVRMISAPKT